MSLPPSPQIHMIFGIIIILSAIFMNNPRPPELFMKIADRLFKFAL